MSGTVSDHSFIVHDPSPPSTGSHVDDRDEELDSLPSISDSDIDSDDVDTEAEKEWRESLQQLQLLLTMVLVPYIGKYFGRKCAYWAWARFMEWKYPVEVVVASPATFKASGAIEAAAPL
ncbi:hypothetical protein EV356DRAFT_529619 [Viridothelium virens]|uniref:Uncharacterized protein n=1 Tax=Viridothelium virens TaxID=1048519 RepID=A0A6A6HJ19_VIRVR|nr:hypothetical protein EV356DRAFT_529619 [Viridothelium virens]